jgi:uncharacterized protein YegL
VRFRIRRLEQAAVAAVVHADGIPLSRVGNELLVCGQDAGAGGVRPFAAADVEPAPVERAGHRRDVVADAGQAVDFRADQQCRSRHFRLLRWTRVRSRDGSDGQRRCPSVGGHRPKGRDVMERLTPVYLVVDVSWSMSMDGKLAAANGILGTVAAALAREPTAARRVRLGVLDFSDDARVLLPLCDLTGDGVTLPTFSVRNGTSFSSAFTVLRGQIEADTQRLGPMAPPTVFFMSDGGPTDDEAVWRAAFEALVAHGSGPVVVPCGMDEAEAHVMGSLVHPLDGPSRSALYMMRKQARAATAITGVGQILASSVVRPGVAGGPVLLPDRTDLPPAVLRYEADEFR